MDCSLSLSVLASTVLLVIAILIVGSLTGTPTSHELSCQVRCQRGENASMFSLFPDGIPVILKGLVDNPLSRCEESPYSSVPILVLVPDPVLVLSLLWCCPCRSGPYFGCLLC